MAITGSNLPWQITMDQARIDLPKLPPSERRHYGLRCQALALEIT